MGARNSGQLARRDSLVFGPGSLYIRVLGRGRNTLNARALALFAGLAVPTATASDFTWTGTLDPRDDEWSVPGHWSGPSGQFPDSRSDSALINGTTLSNPERDLDVSIGAVTIRGGGILDTNGFEYSVFTSGGLSGDTIIEGAGSMLRMYNDPASPNLSGSGIIVNDGGTLMLDTTGLPVELNARKLIINTGGLVEGAGTLAQIGRTGPGSNDGLLRVTGGALVLQPWDAGDVFDWDGASEDGRIEVMGNSELRIEMPVETSFDGRIELQSGSVLDVDDDWMIGALGVVNMEAANSDPAWIRGGALTVAGSLRVLQSTLVLTTETTLVPGGRILVNSRASLTFARNSMIVDASGLEPVGDFRS